ncbi:endonuclease/exonuclease/phosphatase family protein [Dyadobacter luticola]|uniref:Endonuclease n=1 Tax=Dyadobacter luticola TaxID=1979387 RepID=A0A5R9L153_9BACT|nr:endonuclease/exonuclease/phosphatase family protein [Dyadobacter luticola]TLV02253.1 endonuclease [Dyadobacter luticola]
MHPAKLGLEIAGGLIILFTLIPIIKNDYWTFRVFEYPRLQKLFLNILIAIVFIYLGLETFFDGLFLAMLSANAIYIFSKVFPFTFFAKKVLLAAQKHEPKNRLRIISSNVFQDNKNTKGCLQILRKYDPDIILLLETDKFWYEGTKELAEKYPHQVLVPLENTYGMLLYSRLELIEPQVRYLVDEEIPSILTNVRLESGQEIVLYCVHPTPPVPGENSHSTERDKELLLVAKEVKENQLPCIVVGDLNDVAWSYTTELFTKISGMLDPRVGRGFYNTFHAKFPFLRFPLDHVFCSTDFKLIDLKRLPNFNSDHFPILIFLQYEARASEQQEEPVPDQDDLELAEEKINKEVPES